MVAAMTSQLILLAAFFMVFGLLSRLYPCNAGQPKFVSRETPTDLIYVLTLMLASGAVATVVTGSALALIYGPEATNARLALQEGRGALARLPLWGQILLILVISDVIQYWLHRAFHWGALWPFHAIHHSAHNVDWITTFRVHPVNYALYSTSVSALVVLMGFSPVALAVLAPLNMAHAALVHANLNWDFGPFRYVLASPVFHRWHHVDDPEVWDKNFAPTFPILDVIFGTFHMPRGELPAGFGAADAPAVGYLDQLVYPFKALMPRRGPAAGPDPASLPGG
jgi:sterol desaturase/sphingolipid hydroxylase (fatty acid hydroxylase superfamily)